MSGPIISVSRVEMSNLRRVENIELAIEGRDNHWSGIRAHLADNASRPEKPTKPIFPPNQLLSEGALRMTSEPVPQQE
jgi:hypothetical protein